MVSPGVTPYSTVTAGEERYAQLHIKHIFLHIRCVEPSLA